MVNEVFFFFTGVRHNHKLNKSAFWRTLKQKRSNISFANLHISLSWEEIHCLCFWKTLLFFSRSLSVLSLLRT